MDYPLTYASTISLIVVGFLMMFIILLQRGRGGGLAGAFGGLGGQSAFGTKAGDVFTKITIVLAVIWVTLACLSGFAMQYERSQRFKGGSEQAEVQSTNLEDGNDESILFEDPAAESDEQGKQDTDFPDQFDLDKSDTKEQPTSDKSKSKDGPNPFSDTEADKAGGKKQ